MEKKVLVIIDMQNDFVSGSLGSEAAKELPKKIDNFVEKTIPNVFDQMICTVDTHEDDTYFDTLEGKMLPVKHCIEGTDGIMYADPLRERMVKLYQGTHKKGYNGHFHFTILKKPTFGCRSLPIEVRKFMMREDTPVFYLCGLCTDICVVTNALLLRTHYPNSNIYVIEDFCAGTSVENHEAALAVMKSCQCVVINSQDALSKLTSL